MFHFLNPPEAKNRMKLGYIIRMRIHRYLWINQITDKSIQVSVKWTVVIVVPITHITLITSYRRFRSAPIPI